MNCSIDLTTSRMYHGLPRAPAMPAASRRDDAVGLNPGAAAASGYSEYGARRVSPATTSASTVRCQSLDSPVSSAAGLMSTSQLVRL